MALYALRHFFDASDDVLQLPIQGGDIAISRHAYGSHVLIEPLRDVLDAHAQPINRSAQSAGDSVPAKDAADRSTQAQQEHGKSCLPAGAFALVGRLAHAVLVDSQELFAGLDEALHGLRMSVDELLEIQRLAARLH